MSCYYGTKKAHKLKPKISVPLGMSTDSFPDDEDEVNNDDSGSTSSFTELILASEYTPVEIHDGSYNFTRGIYNPTTAALQLCKRQVIYPYLRLLVLIGWRPCGTETHKGCQLFNIIYPVLILILLVFSYVTSILACQGRLNVKKDVLPLTTMSPFVTMPLITTPSPNATGFNWTDIIKPTHVNRTKIHKDNKDFRLTQCDHIFTTYVVPNFLHFTAYLIGFFLFRIQANEGPYALMETVFLKNTNQARLIATHRSFLIVGAMWIIAAMANYFLFIFSYGLGSVTGFRDSCIKQYVSISLMVLGQVVVNCVNVAVVINYSAQCQLIISYLKNIYQRLEEKTVDLREAMKDVLEVKNSLSRVNISPARMVSLCVFNFFEMSVIGLCILIQNRQNEVIVWLYRSLYPVIWFSIMVFPLMQACRVTRASQRFRQHLLQIRVFGYHDASQMDLDSFMLFVSLADLKARVFSIPIRPSYLIGTLCLACFIMLLLFQTSTIGKSNTFF